MKKRNQIEDQFEDFFRGFIGHIDHQITEELDDLVWTEIVTIHELDVLKFATVEHLLEYDEEA